jgi:hypothetical protein
MQQTIQYCRCKVNLAGQNCHTVHFDEFTPVTWPEVQVLMALHGEENVMDIMPIGIGDCWPTQEKNRLAGIYGARVVEGCFPGRNFRMEYMMTDLTDLPYYVEGKKDDEKTPPPPPPKAPPSDAPGTDHDDGEDDAIKATSPIPLPPVFKPGRNRPPPADHKGA